MNDGPPVLQSEDRLSILKITEAAETENFQRVLADIACYGKDHDLRELAWDKLTDRQVLADIASDMIFDHPDYSREALKKLGAAVGDILGVIGRFPENVTRRNAILNNIADPTVREEAIARLLNLKIDLEGIETMRSDRILALSVDAMRVLGKKIDARRIDTIWRGNKEGLEVLKKWRSLNPLTEEEMNGLKTKFINTTVCDTILDVLDHMEKSGPHHIVSASRSGKAIHIVVTNEFHGQNGFVKATEEVSFNIGSDGLRFYVFGSGKYLDS